MAEAIAAPGISPSQAVAHALNLLRTNPALAERQARAILKVLPQDVRAMFVVGAARRRAGDASTARAMFETLVQADPKSAYAHHELGLTLAGLGESAAAIEALRRAAQLKRDMPQAWLSLHDQLALIGDADGAAAAYAEHIRASLKDPNLIQAAEALRDGRLADAQQILRRQLNAAPNDAAAMRMLGETLARLGHQEDAEELLVRCLELAPDFVGARHNYALVLFQQNKAPAAIVQLERLLADDPKNAKYLSLLSACLTFIGEHGRAVQVLEDVLANHPAQPSLWLHYGQNLRIVGRRDEAVAAFRRAIALRPQQGEAYWSMADLKAVRFSDSDLAAMSAQLADPALGADDRMNLHYALGKALEDAGQWTESFAHYAEGAKLRRESLPYDPDENSAFVELSKAVYTREFYAHHTRCGSPDPSPIFVLGLPRSGSTLVEQILASHSSVEATLELPELGHIANRLGRPGRQGKGLDYPELLTQFSAEDCTRLGEEFIAATRHYRRLGRAFFIDKMPNNFFHVGLIKLILPKAKIIDVRRHPMAACFSVFKQHFYRGQSYSYDLAGCARYYRAYIALMSHFDGVLPGAVHRVIYEDLVENTETEVRRLLDYCALDFELGCVRFWNSGRAVSTHSSEQVRRPIFRDGLEQWRRYEPWLEPLRLALGPVLETWRAATHEQPKKIFVPNMLDLSQIR